MTDMDGKIELVPRETQCFEFAFLPLAGHMWQTLEVRTRGQCTECLLGVVKLCARRLHACCVYRGKCAWWRCREEEGG